LISSAAINIISIASFIWALSRNQNKFKVSKVYKREAFDEFAEVISLYTIFRMMNCPVKI